MNIEYIQKLFTTITICLLASTGCAEKVSQSEEEKSASVAPMEKVEKEWDELTDAISDFTYTQRKDMVQTIEEQAEVLGDKAETLEQRLAEKAEDSGEKIDEASEVAVNELKQQVQELKRWSKVIDESSENAWEEVKYDFSQSYSAIKKAISKIEDSFDQEDKNAANDNA